MAKFATIGFLLVASVALAADPAGKQTLVLPIALPPGAPKDAELKCAVTFGPPVPVAALAFSADGKRLYAGGYGEVLAWDLVEGKLVRRIGAGQLSGPVRALAVSGDGEQLIVGDGVAGQSGAASVFDLDTGKHVASFSEPKDVVQCLALTADGKLLAAGAGDTVYVWGLEDRKLVTRFNARAAGVCFSPDGKLLAAGGADRLLRAWEVEDWKEYSTVGVPEAINDVVFLPDGERLAAAVAGPSEWSIRVLRVNPLTRETRAFPCGGAPPLRLACTQEVRISKRLYVGCGDNTVKGLAPGATSQPAEVMRGHAGCVCGLAMSPDGTRIASGSLDGTVRLWTSYGKALATFVQLAPGGDEWAVVAAPGYLATLSPAAIQWRAKGVKLSQAELAMKFGDAAGLRKVLAGENVPSPLANAPAAPGGNDWRARQQRWQRWRNMQGAEGRP